MKFGRLTTDDVTRFEKEIYEIRKDKESVYKYLINNDNNIIEQEVLITDINHKDVAFTCLGTNSFNDVLQFRFHFPNEILRPRIFNADMYPLRPNKSMFAENRPYNYLCNFDMGHFLQIYVPRNDEPIICKAIQKLINMQAQTRFSNVYVNLCAVVYYLRYKKRGNALLTLIELIFKYYGELPYHETWEGIENVKLGVTTMLPILLYSLLSASLDYILYNITQIEALISFQNSLFDAIDSIQDKKLKTKGKYLLWTKLAFDKLRKAKVPIWNSAMIILGSREKDTTEIFYDNEREEIISEMKENLHPLIFNFIMHSLEKINTPEDIIRLDTILRSFRDDRTYYGTNMELAKDKAIRPTVRGKVVEAPIILEKAIDGDLILDATYPKNTLMSRIEYWTNKYTELLRQEFKISNLALEYINYLSTSSAGKKIDLEELPLFNNVKGTFGSILQKSTRKRIVQCAVTMDSFHQMKPVYDAIQEDIIVLVRKQIERRQRGIAGLSNLRLMMDLPKYLALKPFLGIADAPSHGKQTGSARDLFNGLYYSSMDGICMSSLDVTGMDTSIQLNVQINQGLSTIKVLDGLTFDYGPFQQIKFTTKKFIDGKTVDSTRILNGAQHAVAYAITQTSTSTTFKSELFGKIDNQEGTFLSGLFTTSEHHTELLTKAIYMVYSDYMKQNTSLNKALVLHKEEVLGDDIRLFLGGRKEDIKDFIEYMIDKFTDLGLELERDESMNMSTFLQQQVILGRYNGFANRIGLFTTEDRKQRKSVRESLGELAGLCFDLSSRIYNVEALAEFMWIFAYITTSKYVCKIPSKSYDKLALKLKNCINVYEYEHVKKELDVRLIGFQIPLMYYFMYEGGELPAPALQKNDGTFTSPQSIYTPRGQYKRRLLYELSGFKSLDQHYLAKYNVHIADAFIRYKVLDAEAVVREGLIDEGVTYSLANNLESIEMSNDREISRLAYQRLLSYGYRLPKNGVYGYQLSERIKQVFMSVSESEKEMKILGTTLVDKITDAIKVKTIRTYRNDDLMKFQIIKTNNKIGITDKMRYLQDISIGKSLQPFSPTWLLYTIVDDQVANENDLALQIGHAAGHFKNFKYDTQTFEQGVKIYIHNRALLNDFFQAVNIKGQETKLWINAFEYFSKYRQYIFEYSDSPRQLFFLPNDPRCYMRFIDDNQKYTNLLDKALKMRQISAWIREHTHEIDRSRYIISAFYSI